MQIKDYVKPELLVVAVVLYFVGAWLKQSETVKDKYIPLINGGMGIAICAIYVFATCARTPPAQNRPSGSGRSAHAPSGP